MEVFAFFIVLNQARKVLKDGENALWPDAVLDFMTMSFSHFLRPRSPPMLQFGPQLRLNLPSVVRDDHMHSTIAMAALKATIDDSGVGEELSQLQDHFVLLRQSIDKKPAAGDVLNLREPTVLAKKLFDDGLR